MRRSLLILVVSFLSTACGIDEATVDDGLSWGTDVVDTSALGPTTRVRIVAANLTSGSGQDYNAGHGARILQGLKPDIVLIQEFNAGTDSASDIRAFVDSTFGTQFQYVRGADSEQIPNGVISRYPIRSRGNWSDPRVNNTRGFTWALIDAPGPVDVFAVSVHLSTASSGTRSGQTQDLASRIRATAPAGAYVVIGGDFNTGSRTETAVRNLSSLVVTAGPYPADRNGNTSTNENRNKPYDWLVVSSPLSARGTPTVIGGSSFAAGLVADTRVYSPIAELAPARSSDSNASGMQHSAVVRDFLFDADGTVASLRVLAPAGGAQLTAGSSATVQWEGSGVSSVTVEYAADGVSFAAIGSGPGTGSLSWQVPAPATTAGRVRVSGGGVSATSPAFTVVTSPPPASLSVVAPAGGARLALGSTATVTWQGTGVSSVVVAYAADGASYTTIGTGAGSGSLSWTVPGPATTAGRIRVSGGGVSALSAAFTVESVATAGKIIINEVLANEAGSDTRGEFVELYNAGGTAVNVGGWTLADAALVRHTFASGTVIEPGKAVVVSGGLVAGALTASTGALGLSNSGDTVRLASTSGQTIATVTYPSSLASTDGVSMTRDREGDDTSALVLHTVKSALSSSPGRRADGLAF